MTILRNFEKAQDEFRRRVRAIAADQWQLATPCEGWTVRDLVVHAVEGSEMASRLLHGASGEEVTSVFGRPHGDLPAELDAAFNREAQAFALDGALDMTVHHPRAGDLPGSRFCGMRTSDYLLHSWDLARATGADERLPDDLVQVTWDALQPLAPVIAQVGVFGTGPTGTVPEGAPLQTRLLDLSGRRP